MWLLPSTLVAVTAGQSRAKSRASRDIAESSIHVIKGAALRAAPVWVL